MQYILNETEYQAFKTLKEENAKLLFKIEGLQNTVSIMCDASAIKTAQLEKMTHKLEVAHSVSEKDREQIKELAHSRDLLNKQLAEKAHELLVKEAELADLSSKFRLCQLALKEQNEKVATLSASLREAKRDMEGTSRRLKEAEMLNKTRLQSMNNLIKEVRRLKTEHVCIVQNHKTGKVKVISADRADTFRQFGWAVSEEYLVSRLA